MWNNPVPTTRIRYGFKSRNQLPLFMVWREWWDMGEVIHADILFNTMNWVYWMPLSWRAWWLGLPH